MAGRPDGDVWNIVDNDAESQNYGRNFKFDFFYISSEEIKDVVKDYVWQNYRVGNKSLSRLYQELNSHFNTFMRFADAYMIDSLKGLSNVDIDKKINGENVYLSKEYVLNCYCLNYNILRISNGSGQLVFK